MNRLLLLLIPLLSACEHAEHIRMGPVAMEQSKFGARMTFHDLKAIDIQGEEITMDRYKGSKVLVVNTASECGFTPQYQQLQELYETYKDKGLVVIGFPSNDFGGQEPGSEADIATFCSSNYGVDFPMMSKVKIKGEEAHPIYKWLTRKDLNGRMNNTVKWNFNKILIDEEGHLVKHLESDVAPLDDRIIEWVEA